MSVHKYLYFIFSYFLFSLSFLFCGQFVVSFSPQEGRSTTLSVSSFFVSLHRQRDDGNSPRRTTLPVLTASPRSSLVFAVRGTMETHHRGRLSRSSRRLLGLRSSLPSEERWKLTTDDHSVSPQDVSFIGLSDVTHVSSTSKSTTQLFNFITSFFYVF